MFKIFKKKSLKLHNVGENNIITYPKNAKLKNLQIFVCGNNNKIDIKTKEYYSGIIFLGTNDCPVSNCEVIIGENTTCNGSDICLMEDESKVIIGHDVMFSDNIYITCSDTHSILNEDEKLINLGKFVEIGNHVWIGRYAKILKNTKIADNSVVALGSIVTKCFDETNVIIAGNPAKVVKRNINWDRERPNNILKKQ